MLYSVASENNKTLRLRKDEVLVEMVKEWHYGGNVLDEPAEIMVAYVGEKGKITTIKFNYKPITHSKE